MPLTAEENEYLSAATKRHLVEQDARAQAINSIPEPEPDPALPVQPQIPRNQAPGGLVPLNQPLSAEMRGYLSPDGGLTHEGDEFYELQRLGVFDDLGNLTDKGKAFALNREESLTAPTQLYKIRQQSGLDKPPDSDLGDEIGSVAKSFWNAAKGASRLTNPLQPVQDVLFNGKSLDQYMSAQSTMAQSFLEGSLETPASLGNDISAGVKELGAKIQGDDDAYWQAKQQHDLFRQDLSDMNASRYLGYMIGSDKVVQAMTAADDQARRNLGDEQYNQLREEGQAAGAIFGDPTNYLALGAGYFAEAGRATLLSRLTSNVERATVAASKSAELTASAAKARNTLAFSERALELASSQSEKLYSIGNVERAATVAGFGDRMAEAVRVGRETLPVLEQGAQTQTNLLEKLAPSAQRSQQILDVIEQARQIRAVPAQVFSQVTDSIGSGLVKLDAALGSNLKRLRDGKALLAASGVATGHPLLAVPYAAEKAIAAGPLLQKIGGVSKILGEELIQARGSVPYWRRVAENSMSSPLLRATAHFIDTATLGGKAVDAAKTIATGTAAGLPMQLAFQTLSDDGQLSAHTFNKALANSLFFAGTGAAAGAMVNGSLKAKQLQTAGDEINFRRNLPEDQLPIYQSIPLGTRRALGAYQAAFPSLNIELKDTGASFHNPETNTVSINVRSGRILEPLIAHEVQHYINVKGQMEDGIATTLVGDPNVGTGGFLKSKDGKLDPNFSAFIDRYNSAGKQDGLPPLSERQAAIEYFTEAVTDDLTNSVRTGELQQAAGRTYGSRVVRNLARKLVGQDALLSDMWLRMGGAKDASGRMVQGNGLLADGIRELPLAKEINRRVLEQIAGTADRRRMAQAQTQPKLDELAPIDMTRPEIQDTLVSVYDVGPDGKVVRDEKGNPVPISPEVDKQREKAGESVEDDLKTKIDRGENVSAEVQPDGTVEAKSLPDDTLTKMGEQSNLNEYQMANARMINDAAKDLTGETFLISYQKATKTSGKSKSLASFPVELKEVAFFGWKTNKAKNLLALAVDTRKLADNVQMRAASARGKSLYGGNTVAIMQDVQAALDMHRKGQRTDSYYSQKYGAKGPQHKNFINSVFGLATESQKEFNPLFAEDRIGYDQNVVKTYRIDRINQMTRLQGRTPIPYGYIPVKQNWLPNGVPEISSRNVPSSPIEIAAKNIESIGGKLDVSESPYGIVVSRIVVPKESRGKGIGTKTMEMIIGHADATGKTIFLSPSSDFGGSLKRLRNFYSAMGFVDNKGRNRDFSSRETMIRLPEEQR